MATPACYSPARTQGPWDWVLWEPELHPGQKCPAQSCSPKQELGTALSPAALAALLPSRAVPRSTDRQTESTCDPFSVSAPVPQHWGRGRFPATFLNFQRSQENTLWGALWSDKRDLPSAPGSIWHSSWACPAFLLLLSSLCSPSAALAAGWDAPRLPGLSAAPALGNQSRVTQPCRSVCPTGGWGLCSNTTL